MNNDNNKSASPHHRESDRWWKTNIAVIAVAIGLLGNGIILVRYLSTMENTIIAIAARQDKVESSFSDWQKARAVLPERIVRLETAVENVTANVQNLVSELREDRRAEKQKKKDKFW